MGADFWSGVQAILIPFSFLVAKNKIVDTRPAGSLHDEEGKGWCVVRAREHACCRCRVVVVVVEVGALTTSTVIRHSYTHEITILLLWLVIKVQRHYYIIIKD
jgi:hypothetical protein